MRWRLYRYASPWQFKSHKPSNEFQCLQQPRHDRQVAINWQYLAKNGRKTEITRSIRSQHYTNKGIKRNTMGGPSIPDPLPMFGKMLIKTNPSGLCPPALLSLCLTPQYLTLGASYWTCERTLVKVNPCPSMSIRRGAHTRTDDYQDPTNVVTHVEITSPMASLVTNKDEPNNPSGHS